MRATCAAQIPNSSASEAVALRHPVVPVADGFGDRLVCIHRSQLRERNSQVPALPADEHEHVAGTRIFGRQAPDFGDLSLSEWRDDLGSEAPGLEGEPHFVFQVVIPTQSMLFRSISVHDDFVVDSVFAEGVFLGLCHGSPADGAARAEGVAGCGRNATVPLRPGRGSPAKVLPLLALLHQHYLFPAPAEPKTSSAPGG